VIGRGAFFFAAAIAIGSGLAGPLRAAPAGAGLAGEFSGSVPPAVAPAILPEDWFGRPASPLPRRAWQTRKSPLTAMLASFIVPGLGQMYNEREFWALVAAGVEFYFVGEILAEQREMDRLRRGIAAAPEDLRLQALFELHRDNRIQASWLLGLSILVSGLQSFVDAHLFDFDATPLPIEVGPLRRDGVAAGLRLRF
jgi:hypothetical protein